MCNMAELVRSSERWAGRVRFSGHADISAFYRPDDGFAKSWTKDADAIATHAPRHAAVFLQDPLPDGVWNDYSVET